VGYSVEWKTIEESICWREMIFVQPFCTNFSLIRTLSSYSLSSFSLSIVFDQWEERTKGYSKSCAKIVVQISLLFVEWVLNY